MRAIGMAEPMVAPVDLVQNEEKVLPIWRVGHLFQGRYKAILIQKDSHLIEVCRYVVFNPVRALGDRERVDLKGGQRAGHSWGR